MKKKHKATLMKLISDRPAASYTEVNVTLQQNDTGKSFSKTFLDFMEPLTRNEIMDQEKTKAHLKWGLIIWNKAVSEIYPEHNMSEQMER